MPFKPTAASTARRDAAFATLKITAATVRLQPPITAQLRMLSERLKKRNLPSSPIFYLKAAGSPEAQRILSLYYSLPRDQRDLVPLEGYSLAVGLKSTDLLDLLIHTVTTFSRQQSAMTAAANQPSIVEKSVEMALTNEGIDDRTLLAKATGFLPSPSGARTVVNVAANANSAATASPQVAVIAPPPEQTIRRLVDRFNDGKMLGVGQPSVIPTATISQEAEAEYVTVDDSDEDGE
jgi:hypothetical protein